MGEPLVLRPELVNIGQGNAINIMIFQFINNFLIFKV